MKSMHKFVTHKIVTYAKYFPAFGKFSEIDESQIHAFNDSIDRNSYPISCNISNVYDFSPKKWFSECVKCFFDILIDFLLLVSEI